MKQNFLKISVAALVTSLALPSTLLAQKYKDKEKNDDKKKVETIVITRKDANDQKITVVIDGDNITINGKPADEFKDGDVIVSRHKGPNNLRTLIAPRGNFTYNWDNFEGSMYHMDENTAMLGVTTEKTENGVVVIDVSDKSGAEKAGLKEGDVITKVDDQKIEDPDDLTKVIRSHKPGDKVTITFIRDKKEQKATAELTKWNGFTFMLNGDVFPTMRTPKTEVLPPNIWSYSIGNRPKLGLSIQDTEDGKGVKVLDVDEESTAEKAGVKKDDIIVAINDKDVNSADEVSRIVRESRDKPSLMLKINRGGKTQNIEVKIPRKLKTADL
ncbi:MAG: PDZ domain-containing protein [Chitinophagaceae bacterium]